MNILLVSTDNSKAVKVGGKHIHQELLERGWKESGCNVFNAYPLPRKRTFFTRVKDRLNLVFKTPKSKIFIKYINSLMEEMENQVFDYITNDNNIYGISAQDSIAAVAAIKAIKRSGKQVPVILTLHGYLSLESINYGYFKENEKDIVLRFTRNIEQNAADSVDSIVTVDTRIKNYVIDELKYTGRIDTIFNAIDNSRFFPLNALEQGKLKDELGFSKESKIVLIARRMVKKNGIIYGLKSAKEIFDNNPDTNIRFCIAGSGKEKDNLEAFVAENKLDGIVKFVGAIPHDQVDKYYKMSDFILMPSTRSDDVEEATSLSMLEGLVCGKVVIATAIGGMKAVINSENNGLLVEDKDYKSMAEFIIKYSNDNNLYNSIASVAHKYALDNHGYLNHSKEFIEIFKKLK